MAKEPTIYVFKVRTYKKLTELMALLEKEQVLSMREVAPSEANGVSPDHAADAPPRRIRKSRVVSEAGKRAYMEAREREQKERENKVVPAIVEILKSRVFGTPDIIAEDLNKTEIRPKGGHAWTSSFLRGYGKHYVDKAMEIATRPDSGSSMQASAPAALAGHAP